MAKKHVKYYRFVLDGQEQFIKLICDRVFDKYVGIVKVKLLYEAAEDIECVLQRKVEGKKLIYFNWRFDEESKKPKDFYKKNPCNDCPYRLDAPLRKWDANEFILLVKNERTKMGTVYGCHKDDGHTCVGWLMNQDKNRLPSIDLRIRLSRLGVTREYLDKIGVGVPIYESVEEMVKANYPELFNEMSPIIYHE